MSKKNAHISHGMDNKKALAAAEKLGCRVRTGKGGEAKVDHPELPEIGFVNVCTHRSKGKGAPRALTVMLKKILRLRKA